MVRAATNAAKLVSMHTSLSKSKLISYRQCRKRLWLEVHKPKVAVYDADAQARFQAGNEVGDIARAIYDPNKSGQLLEIKKIHSSGAIAETKRLLQTDLTIFEAGFSGGGAFALADILLASDTNTPPSRRMVEVKSSTSVKDYHREDLAIQVYAARSSGTNLSGAAIAHIDSDWTYQGDQKYYGLLKEKDLTGEVFSRGDEVKVWVYEALQTANEAQEPKIKRGDQCSSPFECPFQKYCSKDEIKPEFPIDLLPGTRSEKLKQHIKELMINDLRETDDTLLNELQKRVKHHTLDSTVFFDRAGAIKDLAGHSLPAFFMDFETVQFAVPIWKGTKPYEQLPFQFSVQKMAAPGKIEEHRFLDLTGEDPREQFAEALIVACENSGPIYVYNASFEKARIADLAKQHPRFEPHLKPIISRIVDLLPIARKRYYHPIQRGSWSIKQILPAIAPDLSYEQLDGIKDGGMASSGFLEAIAPGTSEERREKIRQELSNYCALDTLGLIRLLQMFLGIGN
jgi:hypothetical protein